MEEKGCVCSLRSVLGFDGGLCVGFVARRIAAELPGS